MSSRALYSFGKREKRERKKTRDERQTQLRNKKKKSKPRKKKWFLFLPLPGASPSPLPLVAPLLRLLFLVVEQQGTALSASPHSAVSPFFHFEIVSMSTTVVRRRRRRRRRFLSIERNEKNARRFASSRLWGKRIGPPF